LWNSLSSRFSGRNQFARERHGRPFSDTKTAIGLRPLRDLHGAIPGFIFTGDGTLHNTEVLDLLLCVRARRVLPRGPQHGRP
jgi:hypothetical protein